MRPTESVQHQAIASTNGEERHCTSIAARRRPNANGETTRHTSTATSDDTHEVPRCHQATRAAWRCTSHLSKPHTPRATYAPRWACPPPTSGCGTRGLREPAPGSAWAPSEHGAARSRQRSWPGCSSGQSGARHWHTCERHRTYWRADELCSGETQQRAHRHKCFGRRCLR